MSLHLVEAAVQLSSRLMFACDFSMTCSSVSYFFADRMKLTLHPPFTLSTPRSLFFLLCLNQLRQHVVVLRGNMCFLLVGTGCLAP